MVTTPKKFLNLLDCPQREEILANFEHIVLDEADKYFELSFMDQMNSLLEAFKTSEKHFMLFSATLPGAIERALGGLFVDTVKCVIGGRVNVLGSIQQRLVFCQTEEGKHFEMQNVINEGLQVPCLIFVQSKDRVRQLYKSEYLPFVDLFGFLLIRPTC